MSTSILNLFGGLFSGKSTSTRNAKSRRTSSHARRTHRVLRGEGLERRELMTASPMAQMSSLPGTIGENQSVACTITAAPGQSGPLGVSFALYEVNSQGTPLLLDYVNSNNASATINFTPASLGLSAGQSYKLEAETTVITNAPPISGTGPATYDSATQTVSIVASTPTPAPTPAPTPTAQKIATSLSANIGAATVYGQWAGMSAVVNPKSAGAVNPTGTVTFTVDGTTSTETLDQLSRSATWLGSSSLPAGSNTITVTYSGDSRYLGSSQTFKLQVNPAATSTFVYVSTGSAVVGQEVTFTAQVGANAPSKADLAGAQVQFKVNGQDFRAPVTVSANGTATIVATAQQTGEGQITAVLLGTSNYMQSTSNTASVTIAKANTSITITPSANPVTFGAPLTVTLRVAADAPGGGTPDGDVILRLNGSVVGSATLANGQATITIAASVLEKLSVNLGYDMSAEYEGSNNYNSVSNNISERIAPANTTLTLSSSKGAGAVYGTSVTFTAVVKSIAPSTAAVTSGDVIFKDLTTGQILGVYNLALANDGTVSYTTSGLTGGKHEISATYAGNGDSFNKTGTAQWTYTVSPRASSISLPSNMLTVGPTAGSTASISAIVSATPSNMGTPSGTVTFMDGSKVLGTATLVDGKATLKTTGLVAGNNKITAIYNGSANFLSSASNSLTVAVK